MRFLWAFLTKKCFFCQLDFFFFLLNPIHTLTFLSSACVLTITSYMQVFVLCFYLKYLKKCFFGSWNENENENVVDIIWYNKPVVFFSLIVYSNFSWLQIFVLSIKYFDWLISWNKKKAETHKKRTKWKGAELRVVQIKIKLYFIFYFYQINKHLKRKMLKIIPFFLLF